MQHAILAQMALATRDCRASADALVIDAGHPAHASKPLVRDGLVPIRVDPQDRRSRPIRLTSGGKAAQAIGCAGAAPANNCFVRSILTSGVMSVNILMSDAVPMRPIR